MEVDICEQELQAVINNLQLLWEGVSVNFCQVVNIVMFIFDGMVFDILVEEGIFVIECNNFNEGISIVIVADMNVLIFEGKVDELDVGKLKEGMFLLLIVGVIDNQSFDVILEFIFLKGEDEEGIVKFEVWVVVKFIDDVFLWVGYSVNVDIILDCCK